MREDPDPSREATMPTATIDLPDESIPSRFGSPEAFGDALSLATAMFWYTRGQISQGRAVEIAGLDRADFLDALSRERIDLIQVNTTDLERELARARKEDRGHLTADLPGTDRVAGGLAVSAK
jgi:hypothetical protein